MGAQEDAEIIPDGGLFAGRRLRADAPIALAITEDADGASLGRTRRRGTRTNHRPAQRVPTEAQSPCP